MIALQIGLDAVVTWAVNNSDPANLALLGAVYYKLRQRTQQVQARVDQIDRRMSDRHGETADD